MSADMLDDIVPVEQRVDLLKITFAPLVVCALAIAGLCLLSPPLASAIDLQHAADRPPIVQIGLGTTVGAVTIETYGEVSAYVVQRYLSLRPGMMLTQLAIDRDYYNLQSLGGYRVRLVIGSGSAANTITLHWIVMSPWFKLTAHPLYEETPLSDP